ncbi:MAG: hypothetical protein Q9163_002125 [Psora crenata]
MVSATRRLEISRPITIRSSHVQPRSIWWPISYNWILIHLAKKLYSVRRPLSPPEPTKNVINVVCISDTHNQQPELPEGDLLLHAGDLTEYGSFDELQKQLDWLNKQPHPHKILIAAFVDKFPARISEVPGKRRCDLQWGSVIYLENETRAISFPNGRHVRVFGSPLTPQFGNWAFQYPPIRDAFARMIPAHVDILLTHGPPKYHLDSVPAKGCHHLLRAIWESRQELKLVVFGHIHEGYGAEWVTFDFARRLYESLLMGERGAIALLLLVFSIVSEWICHLFGLPPNRTNNSQPTRLVNAAIASARKPVVVQI